MDLHTFRVNAKYFIKKYFDLSILTNYLDIRKTHCFRFQKKQCNKTLIAPGARMCLMHEIFKCSKNSISTNSHTKDVLRIVANVEDFISNFIVSTKNFEEAIK